MEKEDVLKVISIYREKFEENGIEKIDHPHDSLHTCTKPGLEHCHGMLDKMECFIAEDRMEKTFRWLGFIQGVLWAESCYSLEELKDHNRNVAS